MQDDASPLYQPGLPEILAQPPIKAKAKAKAASRGSDGGEQGVEEPAPKAKAKAKGKPKAKSSRAELLKQLAEIQGAGAAGPEDEDPPVEEVDSETAEEDE